MAYADDTIIISASISQLQAMCSFCWWHWYSV